MKNICTYFYQESPIKASEYANISGVKEDIDLIYWKTVYTFFFTSVKINEGINHIFFTNIVGFPYRKEIESLGVTIYDNLILSHPNEGKWASVKFFFDVIDFIYDSKQFFNSDKFALFDTDCIALNNFSQYFDLIEGINKSPIAYLNGVEDDPSTSFHGETIITLQQIYKEIIGESIVIKEKIGGEFFAFEKGGISYIKDRYTQLLNSSYCEIMRTEEQILSMINAELPFIKPKKAIGRLWTTIKYFDVPDNIRDFSFIHLPSEKQTSLPLLFKVLFKKNNINKKEIKELILRITSIESRYLLSIKRIFRTVKLKVANGKV
ncbi:hypothetical protein [Pseudoalteromonas sp. SR43-3]|uniref:hypothetical protein n=1 Tax=Pseudoalteromonas sp. SR43-3 TaxID=2760943 RepID=UPI001603BFED|nr:hypothetical protein [Pseudoalteromonas sp. SR43-3]MBB1275948.1 hypothetical protein [Pseudoalteromonas sp. SR43-3]